MKHLLNDQEDHPNEHENKNPVVNLMESQWKLRQQHDQNTRTRGNK